MTIYYVFTIYDHLNFLMLDFILKFFEKLTFKVIKKLVHHNPEIALENLKRYSSVHCTIE